MTETSLSSALLATLRRDLLLAYRHRSQLANPLVFFTIVVTLFPLGISPDPVLLQTLAPGVVWVAALLAAMLSLEGMFRSDFDDGTLEQIVLSPHPLSLVVLSKVLAHWLISGLPLLFLAPLLALLLHMDPAVMGVLLATLALGTPVLSLVGAIGVALTVGLRRGGVLLSLLVLPLYIPVLIFAAGAVGNADAGLEVTGQLALLGALLALSVALAPLAAAAALRISLN
ncbi:heme exporter protein CcmB [Thiohalomonas denitrificans]|uniref:heme exporter protein CcmB n=1 Tax=Thiohalomonas denitrificans TaxID=415747 RepID=UPI0026F0EB89|nr:heme exporter protein CcmB [Thiohalomonas denitrificans]